MSQIKSLLWKEWFEVRAFFIIAVFVFLGLPLIGGLEGLSSSRRFEIDASAWVYALGGVMSVIIAVGIVVRDLNGRLEQFWRSRPVNVGTWLLTKYCTGLSVVLAALIVPMAVEIRINRPGFSLADPQEILKWHPFLWIAIFSISFALACLIRRGAHAAMVSIAVLLLLYFLPQVLPPLRFLSLGLAMESGDHPLRDVGYGVGMLVLAGAGLAIAMVAVRRDWRIESDRKMIYWSIGAALLILFASASFQLATNLPLLAKTDWPQVDYVTQIHCDGNRGVVLSRRWHYLHTDPSGTPVGETQDWLRPLHLSKNGIELGQPMQIKEHVESGATLWRPQRPDVLYATSVGPDAFWNWDDPNPDRVREYFPRLVTIQFADGKPQTSVQSFPELTTRNVVSAGWENMNLHAQGDRLYMLGRKLMTFDISDPIHPRLLSTADTWTDEGQLLQSRGRESAEREAEAVIVPLPQVPELSPRQRLDMFAATSYWARMSGDLLVSSNYGDRLATYRLDRLTNELATFRRAGRYEASPVERMFDRYVGRGRLGEGLYYYIGGSNSLNSLRISVWDVTSNIPRPVGHYAIPNEWSSQPYPLPEGRLLVFTREHVYLLGPPPK
jgi:hypothetical protein